MPRRELWLLAILSTVLLAGALPAQAERLGGAYRGPSDTGTSAKDAGTSGGADDAAGDADDGPDTGPTGGTEEQNGGEDASGPTSTDAPSGGTSSGSPSGSYSGPTGSPPPPPPNARGASGDSSSGSTANGGAARGPAGGPSEDDGRSAGEVEPGGPGVTAGGTEGGTRGRGTAAAQEAFFRLQYYFEHNREQLLARATARESARQVPKSSSGARFGGVAAEPRELRPLTTEDREQVLVVLQEQVRSKSALVRDAAVLALGKQGSGEAVTTLIDALRRERDLDVFQDTLLALGTTRSEPAVRMLTTYLDKPEVASYALLALGLSGDSTHAAPAALAFFETHVQQPDDGDAVCSAAMALGALGYEPAVAPLATHLLDRRAPELTRVYAAQALGRIGGAQARSALVKSLDGRDDEVIRAAILALGECGDAQTLPELAGKRGMRRSRDMLAAGFACVSVAKVLDRLPSDQHRSYHEELREVATSPQKGLVRAQYAQLALALCDGLDDDTRTYYSEQLDGQRLPRDSMSALAMAAGLGGAEANRSQLARMADSSAVYGPTRGYAALSYALLHPSRETAAQLRSAYAETEDADLRRGALLGLGLVGDRRDVAFLVERIAEPGDGLHVYTRGAAVAALGRIGDASSVGMLTELLDSSDASTRAFAVAALGQLVDRNATPALPQLFAGNNFRLEFETLRTVMSHL